jgi:hypothetical protein
MHLRTRLVPRAIVAALVVLGGAAPGATDFQSVLDAAMGPYYAALAASSRGNVEATQRQVVRFASAWEAVVRQGRTGAPPALAADPEWDRVLQRGTEAIRLATQRLRRRDAEGAHSDLEGIRLALRAVRQRHGLLTFDDHLTGYHEAMERAVGHVGGRNEIVLRGRDFDDIREDVATARAEWDAATEMAGGLTRSSEWVAAARQVRDSLEAADRAAASADPLATTAAVAAMKVRYYDMLGVLAHVSR